MLILKFLYFRKVLVVKLYIRTRRHMRSREGTTTRDDMPDGVINTKKDLLYQNLTHAQKEDAEKCLHLHLRHHPKMWLYITELNGCIRLHPGRPQVHILVIISSSGTSIAYKEAIISHTIIILRLRIIRRRRATCGCENRPINDCMRRSAPPEMQRTSFTVRFGLSPVQYLDGPLIPNSVSHLRCTRELMKSNPNDQFVNTRFIEQYPEW